MKLIQEEVLRVSSSVQTVPPEASKSLEQAWQRRREELNGWRPSRGWLNEVRAEPKKRSAAPPKLAPTTR